MFYTSKRVLKSLAVGVLHFTHSEDVTKCLMISLKTKAGIEKFKMLVGKVYTL